MVGRGVGIFHKRALFSGADRGAHLASEAARWHGRGRRTAPQRYPGRFSLCPLKSHDSVSDRFDCAEHDFCFPSYLSDAAALRAQYSPSWGEEYGMADGGVGQRRLPWLDWLA